MWRNGQEAKGSGLLLTLVRVKPVLGMALGEINSVYGRRISIRAQVSNEHGAWGDIAQIAPGLGRDGA